MSNLPDRFCQPSRRSLSCACYCSVTRWLAVGRDNGKTWPHSQLLDTESGYTTPAMLSGSEIGIVYEKGGCSISIAIVDAKQIIGGGNVP